MTERNLDVFLDTFKSLLEGALLCLNDGKLFNEKIHEIEQALLDASPELVSQLGQHSIETEQAKKIKFIISLIQELELKSNAKLNWFQGLDKHLKRTLANDI
ncbi:hypothetical protein OAS27_02210 [Alphaproteobacteria bacterium]|nr:hypothetical protein [Alphaproteobacteria bacterium]